ncbi:Uncharacterised protein [Mycobacteroides abscessus subsp. abscessus]|nr:Uncharacterised protein [Mycobacteroides abscessus subsp. abscessus]
MSDQWPPPGPFGPGQPYGGNPYGVPGVPPGMPYPQYPQPQYPQPVGYGMPMPAAPAGPSNVTAIIAAVLSLLGAVSTGFQAFSSWYVVATLSSLPDSFGSRSEARSGLLGLSTGMAVVQTIVAVALLAGGVLLIMGRSVGRWIVVGSCVVVVLSNVVGMFAALTIFKRLETALGGYEGMQGIAGLSMMSAAVPIMFALVTGVLAALNSTRDWCRWKTGQAAPAAPIAYPGYPQPY